MPKISRAGALGKWAITALAVTVGFALLDLLDCADRSFH
jgi:hypothetical protein